MEVYRRPVCTIVMLLLTSMFSSLLLVRRAEAATIMVPDDYPTIQAAVNAAIEGDTVYVRSGTYYEGVAVNKAISLTGQNRETTKIDGGYQAAVSITADNAVVAGFTLFSPLPQSHGNTVFINCKDSILRNNVISAGTGVPYIVNGGVEVRNSTNITVENNEFMDIQYNAVHLWSSSNCIVRGNVMTNVYYGVGVWWASNNIIEANTVTKTHWGYEEMQYHTGVPPVAGVALWGSRNNKVTGNTISNNSVCGICILGSSATSNSIVDNVMLSNGYGSETTWHGRPIKNSDVWVGEEATGNTIYHNHFDNQSMAYSEGGNAWDNGYPSGGNYWKDYEGADVKKGPDQDQPGSDDIGDIPININNSTDQDRYPLMYPLGTPPPPTRTLTITSAAEGATNPAPGSYVYSEGETVPVLAIPETGYILDHWELDSANVGATNPIDVLVDADHSLHSFFTWVGIRELTITTTTGGTTNPASGTEFYTKGSVVTVTALASTGYVFDRWELDGANAGTAVSLNVTMNIDHTLHAIFTATYNLTITTTTGGTTNPTPGEYTHHNGTIVTVTAVPHIAEDYYFDFWDLDGANNPSNPINVTMNMDHSLKAIFALTEYTLAITTTAGGTTNPSTGTYLYPSGTRINVTATPEDGYYLDYWMLDGVKIGFISLNPAVLDMKANHTLHVAFAQLNSGHDVALKNIHSPKTVVGQGYTSNINVLTMNVGSFTESFNITVIVDETPIVSQSVTLESGAFITLTLTWNTTGFDKGNYTITAAADSVPNETDLEDNNLSDGWIIIAMVGDITGDGKCDIKDLAQVAKHYGQTAPPAPPNCDVTGPTRRLPDGKIDIRDLATVAIHYGEVDP